jgi:hypothetical protein
MAEMRMTVEELDKMGKLEFEQWVHENWAEDRPDYRPRRFGNPSDVVDDLPLGVEKLLEQLKISQGELVGLMHTGKLVRPRRTGNGKVEWRRAELMSAMPLKDWRP